MGRIINMCIDTSGIVITDLVHAESRNDFAIIVNNPLKDAIWIVRSGLGIETRNAESRIGRFQNKNGSAQNIISCCSPSQE